MELKSLTIARTAGKLALSKKGFDVKILKLKSLSSICDYFVIVSGDVDVHVNAISDAIEEGLLKKGVKPWHREGVRGGTWILLDYVDVVVHIFQKSVREFYALEKLWGDAPVEELN
ncbi:MAG: ribosome silencing factor [Candidatus Zixiibacteriota bacterium]|nr:MAG: ribosome silencing factor [candidate division Zixibacteria bacterium]HDL02634.1 ribosome silencing factor [candidate division Zixibacteria bacterium]